MIAAAKRDGVRLTVETCPHYLALCAEEIPDGATMYKCCPPIREESNRESLWRGLSDGTIDSIASDHSPCTVGSQGPRPSETSGCAWGGISSLQLGLPVIWTEAQKRGIPLTKVIEWMAVMPAALARMTRKGQITAGFDADFVIFAPDEEFVVDAKNLWHKNPITPYDGRTLAGVVRTTFLRGKAVDGLTPRGDLLRCGST